MSLMDEMNKRKGRIEKEISEVFDHNRSHPMWENMAYYPEAGGKRLRPFLTMITTGAFGEEESRAIPYAVAIELVHNFTLVHDDIMDKDERRRGKKTLYKKIGDARAINAGDGLFALAFKKLAETDVDEKDLRVLLDELSTSIVRVAEGQEEDLSFQGTYEITEDEFIDMIEKKTGYLFRAATRGGAMIGGADEASIKAVGEYARKMGIAFQIQDDYLDLIGDEELIGKDVGSDIGEGKKTLMVIKSLSELPHENKERLIEILEKESNTTEEVREAVDLFEKAGAVEYSKDLAEKYAREAKEHLEILSDGEYKKMLEELIEFMISRNR